MNDNDTLRAALRTADLTQKRLRERLSYDIGSGEFRWRKNGRLAGCLDRDGYRVIGVDGRLYRAARLAWLYVIGQWPDKLVDHKDTIRSNDRWDNLRLVTPSQNSGNAKISKVNKTGFKGVCYFERDKRYFAYIRAGGRQVHLGSFDTAEEAALAYAKASTELHGEYGRVSNPGRRP